MYTVQQGRPAAEKERFYGQLQSVEAKVPLIARYLFHLVTGMVMYCRNLCGWV